jgi:hypothetical protein
MKKDKEKPYLEFGGNSFYINLESILDAIKIESTHKISYQNEEPKTTTKKTKGKSSTKKKEEIFEPEETLNLENGELSFDQTPGIQVDISKWEVLRLMMECVMNTNTEIDDKLGMAGLNNDASIPFKIAFNTLLKYNIIQEEE